LIHLPTFIFDLPWRRTTEITNNIIIITIVQRILINAVIVIIMVIFVISVNGTAFTGSSSNVFCPCALFVRPTATFASGGSSSPLLLHFRHVVDLQHASPAGNGPVEPGMGLPDAGATDNHTADNISTSGCNSP